MDRYVAVVHTEDSLSYGISFPDFPGCISAGDTFEQALDNAAQALRFHVEGMIEDGEPVPPPTDLATLRADPEFAEDFADAIVTLVPLLPRGKPIRLNISMDEELVRAIDQAAAARSLTRSGFLAEAARKAITIG